MMDDMTRQLARILRQLRSNPVFQHFQREHEQKIAELLDELQIDPTAKIFVLALDDPEKIIELAKRLEGLEADGTGRPEGTTIHTYDEQMLIAAEATELKKRGRRQWKQHICEKYSISQRTLERYLNAGKNAKN